MSNNQSRAPSSYFPIWIIKRSSALEIQNNVGIKFSHVDPSSLSAYNTTIQIFKMTWAQLKKCTEETYKNSARIDLLLITICEFHVWKDKKFCRVQWKHMSRLLFQNSINYMSYNILFSCRSLISCIILFLFLLYAKYDMQVENNHNQTCTETNLLKYTTTVSLNLITYIKITNSTHK